MIKLNDMHMRNHLTLNVLDKQLHFIRRSQKRQISISDQHILLIFQSLQWANYILYSVLVISTIYILLIYEGWFLKIFLGTSFVALIYYIYIFCKMMISRCDIRRHWMYHVLKQIGCLTLGMIPSFILLLTQGNSSLLATYGFKSLIFLCDYANLYLPVLTLSLGYGLWGSAFISKVLYSEKLVKIKSYKKLIQR